jgi:DNA repair protein RadC
LNIKQLAYDDRPREKALKQGISALSDAELIAILLRTGHAEETAIQVAQKILIDAKNNLNMLGKLSIKDLMKCKGVAQVKAITIAAAMELGRRRSDVEPVKRDVIQSSNDAFCLFYPFLCDLDHEQLWVALTNNAAKVVEKKMISKGGVDNTAVDLLTILKLAINTTCHGIILCHNHPSGSIKPSAHDDVLTSRLKQAAKLLDIELLDHIIISDKYYYSYADEGRI